MCRCADVRGSTSSDLLSAWSCARRVSARSVACLDGGWWAGRLPAEARDSGAPSERKCGGWDGLRSAGRRWCFAKVVGAIHTDDGGFHGTERNDG